MVLVSLPMSPLVAPPSAKTQPSLEVVGQYTPTDIIFINVNIILLTNSTFSHNRAAYCGVLDADDQYLYSANIVGNTFTHNRAVGQVAGNNGGGVIIICIGNASISVFDNKFNHNSAAGDAGVLQVDKSDVIIERSIFSNNTAGGNGGVFHTYFYPTSYTITQSSVKITNCKVRAKPNPIYKYCTLYDSSNTTLS